MRKFWQLKNQSLIKIFTRFNLIFKIHNISWILSNWPKRVEKNQRKKISHKMGAYARSDHLWWLFVKNLAYVSVSVFKLISLIKLFLNFYFSNKFYIKAEILHPGFTIFHLRVPLYYRCEVVAYVICNNFR